MGVQLKPKMKDHISCSVPSWEREKFSHWWSPGPQLLRCVRKYQYWKASRHILSSVLCRYWVFWHRFWGVMSGCDIPLNSQIGGGLKLIHPNGVVIHPKACIGVNCLILQQVTIVQGVKTGGHVDIGAGAKIIRPVSIGNNVSIGANAVVLTDIPDGATVVGVPAKIVRLKKD